MARDFKLVVMKPLALPEKGGNPAAVMAHIEKEQNAQPRK